MIKKILFICCATIFTGCALNFEDTTTTVTTAIDGNSVNSLKISHSNGVVSDIRVKGTPSSDSLRVTADIKQLVLKNQDATPVKIALDDMGNNNVQLGYDIDSDNWLGISVDNIIASIPSGIGLHLNSISGDISATGMNSPINAKATSGDITIQSTKYCNVSVTSGDVSLSTIDGATVNTTSGDVSVSVTSDYESFQKIDINVTSGDVKISLPRRFEAWLDLDVTSGDIKVDGGRVSGDSHRGSLNGGTSGNRLIRVKSTSGNITISLY